MKKYVIAILGMCLCWAGAGAVHVEREEGAPKELSFNGQTYYLQYETENVEMKLREYLPKGQTFDNYTHMLALRAYKIKITPSFLTAAMAKNYGTSHPNSKMGVRPLNSGYVIDFVEAGAGRVEFNIFKIVPGTPGPVSLQYVYRAKTSESEEFVKTVKARRKAWLDKMEKTAVPAF